MFFYVHRFKNQSLMSIQIWESSNLYLNFYAKLFNKLWWWSTSKQYGNTNTYSCLVLCWTFSFIFCWYSTLKQNIKLLPSFCRITFCVFVINFLGFYNSGSTIKKRYWCCFYNHLWLIEDKFVCSLFLLFFYGLTFQSTTHTNVWGILMNNRKLLVFWLAQKYNTRKIPQKNCFINQKNLQKEKFD